MLIPEDKKGGREGGSPSAFFISEFVTKTKGLVCYHSKSEFVKSIFFKKNHCFTDPAVEDEMVR